MLVILKSLSDETRLKIVCIVLNEGKCGAGVCFEGLKLTKPILAQVKKYSLNKECLDKNHIVIRL